MAGEQLAFAALTTRSAATCGEVLSAAPCGRVVAYGHSGVGNAQAQAQHGNSGKDKGLHRISPIFRRATRPASVPKRSAHLRG
jgi:hypothetical protein